MKQFHSTIEVLSEGERARCGWIGKSGKPCCNRIEMEKMFCPKHDPERVRLYFTDDYAGYWKLTSAYVDHTLAGFLLARGVAVRRDGRLHRAVNRIGAFDLHLTRNGSPELLVEHLYIVRVMIAHENDFFLFRFFNTEHEPHHKVVQDFITHEWFTDKERMYLKNFIHEHFIQRRSIRHLMNDYIRARKKTHNNGAEI